MQSADQAAAISNALAQPNLGHGEIEFTSEVLSTGFPMETDQIRIELDTVRIGVNETRQREPAIQRIISRAFSSPCLPSK